MFTVSLLIHHAVGKISRDGFYNYISNAEMAYSFPLYADGGGLLDNFIPCLFNLYQTQALKI